MLPAVTNSHQSFRHFRAFLRLLPETAVAYREAGTQTEEQMEVDGVAPPVQLQLPPEVLQHIFQYLAVVQLKAVRRVCHGWKLAVDGSPRLMDRMVMKFPTGFLLDEDYEPECRLKVPNVMFEDVRMISVGPETEIKLWWEPIGMRLTSLCLIDTMICILELSRMLNVAVNLKELFMRDVRCPSLEGTTELAIGSGPNLNRMHRFFISGHSYDVILPFLAKSFPRLKDFECDDQFHDNDREQDVIFYLETAQNALHSIQIAGTESLLYALQNLPRLNLKRMFLWQLASDRNLLELVRVQTNITVLILKMCQLDNTILTEIGYHLPNLQCLDVEVNASDPTHTYWTPRFMQTMPNLKQLSISYRGNSPRTIHFDKDGTHVLEELRLSKFIIAKPFFLKPYHHHLKHLALLHTAFESWGDLFEVIPYNALASLKLHCISVAHDVEDSLVDRFRNLRQLELISLLAGEITLETMFRLMKNLEAVRLHDLQHATDLIVMTLISNSPKLRKLSLRLCPVTDFTAEHILEHCSELELLDVGICRGISEGARKRLGASERFELRSWIEIIPEELW